MIASRAWWAGAFAVLLVLATASAAPPPADNCNCDGCVRDEETGQCGCTDGLSYDAVGEQCIVPPQRTACTGDLEYNELTHKCVTAWDVSCPTGLVWSFVTLTCEEVQQVMCPTGQVYDDAYHTCREDCESGGQEWDWLNDACYDSCPEGQSYDAVSTTCVEVLGAVVCPTDAVFDSVLNECLTCAEGTEYLESAHACVEILPVHCPANAHVADNACTCDTGFAARTTEGGLECVDTTCAEGTAFDSVTFTCVDEPTVVICGSGNVYDPSTGSCVPAVPTACPSGDGWTYDTINARCVRQVTTSCADGYLYDRNSMSCLRVAVTHCGEGNEWHEKSGRCRPICPRGMHWRFEEEECLPSCPPGGVQDDRTEECVFLERLVCPLGWVWAEHHGRCAPLRTTTCEPGKKLDQTTYQCFDVTPVHCLNPEHEYEQLSLTCIPVLPTQCPPGRAFDSVHEECVPLPESLRCEHGFYYDSHIQQCVAHDLQSEQIACSPGSHYDKIRQQCVEAWPTQCAPGEQYDATNRRCVLLERTACPEGTWYLPATMSCITPALVQCAPGTVYDHSTRSCVRMLKTTCDAGTYLNEKTLECRPLQPVRCAPGTVLYPEQGICVHLKPTTCRDGTVFDPATTSCVHLDTVRCPPGSALKLDTNECIKALATTCPPGLELDESTDRCEVPGLTLTWSSDNSRSLYWAKEGDTLTVHIHMEDGRSLRPGPLITVGSEAKIALPVISTLLQTSWGPAYTDFEIEFELSVDLHPEGRQLVRLDAQFEDGGEIHVAQTEGSDSVYVLFDGTPPTLDSSAFYNAEEGARSLFYAKAQSEVAVDLDFSEPVHASSLRVGNVLRNVGIAAAAGETETENVSPPVGAFSISLAPTWDFRVNLNGLEGEDALLIDVEVTDMVGNALHIQETQSTQYGRAIISDFTAPSLSWVGWESDNFFAGGQVGDNPSFASDGDSLLASFTFSEPVLTGSEYLSLQLNSNAEFAVELGSSNAFDEYCDGYDCSEGCLCAGALELLGDDDISGTFAFPQEFPQAQVTAQLSAQDWAGNVLVTSISQGTDGNQVSFDNTAPGLSSITWQSNNPTWPSVSTAGDRVTVRLAYDEPVSAPVVSIFGEPAVLSGRAGLGGCRGVVVEGICSGHVTYSEWDASVEMGFGRVGRVEIISAAPLDRSNNAGDGAVFSGTEGTDGFYVTHDVVPPQVTYFEWTSSHPLGVFAGVGDEIVIHFRANEPVREPLITLWNTPASVEPEFVYEPTECEESAYSEASDGGECEELVTETLCPYRAVGSSNDCDAARLYTHWIARFVLTHDQPDGNIAAAVSNVMDAPGNTGEGVSGSEITFDGTPPTIFPVIWWSNNPNSIRLATEGDAIFIYMQASEPVTRPTFGVTEVFAQPWGENAAENMATVFEARLVLQGDALDQVLEGLVPVQITGYWDAVGNAGDEWDAVIGTDGNGVFLDYTDPAYTSVTWRVRKAGETGPGGLPVYSHSARVGDTLELDIVVSEPSPLPTVTILGVEVDAVMDTSTRSCDYMQDCQLATHFTASLELEPTHPEGPVFVSLSAPVDEATNAGAPFAGSVGTDAMTVNFRARLVLLSGVFDSLSYHAGQVATITLTFDSFVQSASAQVNGRPATSVTVNANNARVLTVTYELQSDDTEGGIDVVVNAVDRAGISVTYPNTEDGGQPAITGPPAVLDWTSVTLAPLADAATGLTSKRTVKIRATFSWAVSGVTPSSFSVTNTGTVTIPSWDLFQVTPVGGVSPASVWEVIARFPSPLAFTSVDIRLNRGAAGVIPANRASNAVTVVYQPPTAHMEVLSSGSGTIAVQVSVSEAVSGLTADKFIVTPAHLGLEKELAQTEDPLVYILTVHMRTVLQADVRIVLPEAAVVDPTITGPTIVDVSYTCGFSEACSVVNVIESGPSPAIHVDASSLTEARSSIGASFRWEFVGAFDNGVNGKIEDVLADDDGSGDDDDMDVQPRRIQESADGSNYGSDSDYGSEGSDGGQVFWPDGVVWHTTRGNAGQVTGIDVAAGLPGGYYVWALTTTGDDGAQHTVFAAIEIVELTVLQPHDKTIYLGQVLDVRWSARRIPAERYVLVQVSYRTGSVTGAADPVGTPDHSETRNTRLSSQVLAPPTGYTLFVQQIVKVSPGRWQYSIPPQTTPSDEYVVRVVAVNARSPRNPYSVGTNVRFVNPTVLTIPDFGPCSVECGVGEQTRSLQCVDIRGTAPVVVPVDVCARYQNLPASTQVCEQEECETAAWVAFPWGPCNAVCGGGVQERAVECMLGNAIVSESECTGPMISTQRECALVPCASYEWATGSWGECDQPCGGGVQERDVFCRVATTHNVVNRALCAAHAETVEPPNTRECNTDRPCSIPHFITTPWSTCSQPCDAGNAFRDVQCFFDAETPATPDTVEDCVVAAIDAGVEVPSPVRTCNTAPCVTFGYLVSPWTECSVECGGGTRTRELGCARTIGGVRTSVALQECHAKLPAHLNTPTTVQACNEQACNPNFCDQTNPCSGRGDCDAEEEICNCAEGFRGERCESLVQCLDGAVLDADGECCDTGIVNIEGVCCEGLFPALDSRGQCCESGFLDACGECDGSNLFVDALGECCQTGLDEAGLCCAGTVDVCGVCNGQSECPAGMIITSLLAGMSVQDFYDQNGVDELTELATSLLGFTSGTGVVSIRLDEADAIPDGEGGSEGSEGSLGSGSESAYADDVSVGRLLMENPDLKAEVQAAVAAKDYRRLTTLLETIMTITVTPGSEASPPGLERRMASRLQHITAPELTITEVMDVERQPVCGNGVCESGERCATLTDTNCCSVDCAFQIIPCPTRAGSDVPCSGRGRCISAVGECDCFEGMGYRGADCNTCAAGFTKLADGDCYMLTVSNLTGGISGQQTPVILPGDSSDNSLTWMIPFIVALALLCCMCICWWLYCRSKALEEDPDIPHFAVGVKGQNFTSVSKGAAVSIAEEKATEKTELFSHQSFYVQNPDVDPDDVAARHERTLERGHSVRGKKHNALDRALMSSRAFGRKKNKVGIEPVNTRSTANRGKELTTEDLIVKPDAKLPHMYTGTITASTIPIIWSIPEDDGGAEILRYKISYTVGDHKFSTFTDDQKCSFTIGGGHGEPVSEPLKPGQTVTDITVVAVNKVGESEDAVVLPFARTATFPGAPSELKLDHTTGNAFKISWKPSFDDGGVPLTSYVVAYQVRGGLVHKVDTGSLDEEFTLGVGEGTPPSEPFATGSEVTDVRVCAVNAAGRGAWSEPIESIKMRDVAPEAPTQLIAGRPTLHTLALSWTTPPGPPPLSHIVTYTVAGEEYQVNTRSPEPAFVIGSSEGAPESDPLPVGSTVTAVSVVAVAGSGSSGRSNTIDFARTLSLPGNPGEVRVAASTGSSIRLEWKAPSDTGGSVVTGYLIRYVKVMPDGGEMECVVDTQDTHPTFMIGGGTGEPASAPLPKGTTIREITVAAVTRAGRGARSEPPITGHTLATPMAPSNVELLPARTIGDGASSTTVLPVAWVPPAAPEEGDSAIDHYVVSYAVGDETYNIRVDDDAMTALGGDKAGFLIGSGDGAPASQALPQGAKVTDIRVAAVSEIGTGAFSRPPLAAVMPGLVEAPSNLHVDSNVDGKVSLAWNPAPQEEGAAPVDRYIVSYFKDSVETSIETEDATPAFELGSGRGHPAAPQLRGGDVLERVMVRPVNSVGVGAPSPELSRVVVIDKAGAATVRVGDTSPTTIPLEWNPPASYGGASLEDWVVRYKLGDEQYAIRTGSVEPAFVIGSGAGTPASPPLEEGTEVRDVSVTAVTSAGEGTPSAPIPSIRPLAVAGDPTNLHLIEERLTKETIPIDWVAPADGFDGEIVGYKVQYTVDGDTRVVNTDSVETEFVLGSGKGTPPSEPLEAGSEVTNIAVAAITTRSESSFSTAMPPIRTLSVPSAPSVSYGKTTATSVSVTWRPLEGEECGGAPIDNYKVFWSTLDADKPAGQEEEHQATVDGTAAFYVIGDGDVSAGATVSNVRVCAVSRAGEGALSDALEPRTLAKHPDPPRESASLDAGTGVTVLSEADSKTGIVELMWAPPADDGGAEIVAYTVMYTVTGSDGAEQFATRVQPNVSADGTIRFMIGGGGGTPASNPPPPATEISNIQVCTINTAGKSVPATSDAVIKVAAPEPPRVSRPMIVRLVRLQTSITVCWEDPLVALRNAGGAGAARLRKEDRITEFEVQVKPTSGWGKAVRGCAIEHDITDEMFMERPDLKEEPELAWTQETLEEVYARRAASSARWPSWFEDVYEDDERSWVVAKTATVDGTNDRFQYVELDVEPDMSYDVRVRARNQHGVLGPWSTSCRPVFVPGDPEPIPARRAVRGLQVNQTGGGFIASAPEIKRFIKDNLEADQQLRKDFRSFVSRGLWGLMQKWCKNQANALSKERIAGVPRQKHSDEESIAQARMLIKRALPRVGKPEEKSPADDASFGEAAVRRSRAIWVPIVESAAAGRPSLLAMLPKRSSKMAGGFKGDRKIAGVVKRKGKKKRSKAASDTEATTKTGGRLAKVKLGRDGGDATGLLPPGQKVEASAWMSPAGGKANLGKKPLGTGGLALRKKPSARGTAALGGAGGAGRPVTAPDKSFRAARGTNPGSEEIRGAEPL